MINQVIDKIVISNFEPIGKNILWFHPESLQFLYYSDGWKSVFEYIEETKQDKIDNNLKTVDKSIVGAINEVKGILDYYIIKFGKDITKIFSNIDTLSIEVNKNKETLTKKQNKIDNSLSTTNKDIVLAINELHNTIKTHAQKLLNHKEIINEHTSILSEHSDNLTQINNDIAYCKPIVLGLLEKTENVFFNKEKLAYHLFDTNTSNGARSISVGSYNNSNGDNSVVFGRGNTAPNESQFAIGNYGEIDNSGQVLFQLGIGTSSENRRNAFTITKNGTFSFANSTERTSLNVKDFINLKNLAGILADLQENIEDWVREYTDKYSTEDWVEEQLAEAARDNTAALNELREEIFDPDGNVDDVFLHTMMLQVGADSMNFSMDKTYINPGTPKTYNNINLYKTGSNYYLEVFNDTLRHFVYSLKDSPSDFTWEITNNLQVSITPNTTYYICLKCSVSELKGEWLVDTTQHKVDEDANYYYFNWGIVLWPNNTPVLMETRGCSYMYGDNLVCGKISSIAGNSYFDLNNGNFVLGYDLGGNHALSYINNILTIKGVAKESDVSDLLRKYNLLNGALGDLQGNFNTLNESTKTALQEFRQDWRNYEAGTEDRINDALAEGLRPYLATLDSLQQQVDGEITTWFLEGAPTLDNEPAKDWTTIELKDSHIGDTYTDITDYIDETQTPTAGFCYRWCREKKEDNSVEYHWHRITDAATITALQAAQDAISAADGKVKLFLSAYPDRPTNYHIGDLWILQDNLSYEGETIGTILTANQASPTYDKNHWSEQVKYTDDSYAEQVAEDLKSLQVLYDTVNNNASEALKRLNAFNNGVIDPSEVSSLKKEKERVIIEKIRLVGSDGSGGEASVWSANVSPTEYIASYNKFITTIDYYINTADKETNTDGYDDNGYKIIITDTTSDYYYGNLEAYYTKARSLCEAIVNAAKAYAANIKSDIEEIKADIVSFGESLEQAQDALQQLQNYYNDIADGDVIDAGEKQTLYTEYRQINDEHLRISREKDLYYNTQDDAWDLYYTAYKSYKEILESILQISIDDEGKITGPVLTHNPKNPTSVPKGFKAAMEGFYSKRVEVYTALLNAAKKYQEDYANSLLYGITIGGTNLLTGSESMRNVDWEPLGNAVVITDTENAEIDNEEAISFKNNKTTDNKDTGGTSQYKVQLNLYDSSKMSSEDEYTLSVYVKRKQGSSSINIKTNLCTSANSPGSDQVSPFTSKYQNGETSTEVERVTFTGYKPVGDKVILQIGATYPDQYNTIEIALNKIQLEKGNIATDWTPSPKDIQNDIKEVNDQLDSIKESIGKFGTCLSDGELTKQEQETIKKELNNLQYLDGLYQRDYNDIINNVYLSSAEGGQLRQAYQNYNTAYGNYKDLLNEIVDYVFPDDEISVDLSSISYGNESVSYDTYTGLYAILSTAIDALNKELEDTQKIVQDNIKKENLSTVYNIYTRGDIIYDDIQNGYSPQCKLLYSGIPYGKYNTNGFIRHNSSELTTPFLGCTLVILKDISKQDIKFNELQQYANDTDKCIAIVPLIGGTFEIPEDLDGKCTVYLSTIETSPIDDFKTSSAKFSFEDDLNFIYYVKGITIAYDLKYASEKLGDKIEAYKFLSDVIQNGETTIAGGLVLSNVLAVTDSNGNVTGGLSGLDKYTEEDGTEYTDNVLLWGGGSYYEAYTQAKKAVQQGLQDVPKLPTLFTKLGYGSNLGPLEVMSAASAAIFNSTKTSRILFDTNWGTENNIAVLLQKKDSNGEWVTKSMMSDGNIQQSIISKPFAFQNTTVTTGSSPSVYFNAETQLDSSKNWKLNLNTGHYIQITITNAKKLPPRSHVRLIGQIKLFKDNSTQYKKQLDSGFISSKDNEDTITWYIPIPTEIVNSSTISNKSSCRLQVRLDQLNIKQAGIEYKKDFNDNTRKDLKITCKFSHSISLISQSDETKGVYLGEDGIKVVIDNSNIFTVRNGGNNIDVNIQGLPPSDTDLQVGQLYKSGNYLMVKS